jgi:hypothetical protein
LAVFLLGSPGEDLLLLEARKSHGPGVTVTVGVTGRNSSFGSGGFFFSLPCRIAIQITA